MGGRWRDKQKAGGFVTVKKSVFAARHRPAIRPADQFPAVRRNTVDRKAGTGVPQHYRMAACRGSITGKVYRHGSKQVGAAVLHQGLMDRPVD